MKHLVTGLVIILFVSCTTSESGNMEADLELLRESNNQYATFTASQDIEKWIKLYDDQAILYPAGSSPIQGLDKIQEHGNGFASLQGFGVEFELVNIEVSNDGTMGYTTNHLTLSYTNSDGDKVTTSGPDFHVWKRQEDGSWKIVIDMWNSDQPDLIVSQDSTNIE